MITIKIVGKYIPYIYSQILFHNNCTQRISTAPYYYRSQGPRVCWTGEDGDIIFYRGFGSVRPKVSRNQTPALYITHIIQYYDRHPSSSTVYHADDLKRTKTGGVSSISPYILSVVFRVLKKPAHISVNRYTV